MKQATILFALLLVLGAGCPNATLTSDFKPTVGASSTPSTETGNEGPYDRQLVTAISYDGFEYLPIEDGWITDQANVPDLVRTDDGTLYLYYTGWIVGDRLNETAVAISKDEGVSWSFHYLTFEDAPEGYGSFVDPDVVLLDDGTFSLYFTSGDWVGSGIYFAESTDGIHFTFLGAAVKPVESSVLDSTTIHINDTWHMYVMTSEGVQKIWHLLSDDGITWEITEMTQFVIDGISYMPSNGIWIDGVFYLFMFNSETGDIRSQSTTDGYNWTVDKEVHIGPLDDGRAMMDATVIQRTDGSYLMVYVTTVQ